MNSEANVNARMLNLYPIDIVKSHFVLKGHKGNVISTIATTKTTAEIDQFASLNINHNKLHVYIFDINPPFNPATFNDSQHPFPFPIMKEVSENNVHHIFIKPQLVYYASLFNVETKIATDIAMIFQQPIQISLTDRHLIIKATILEKSVAAYVNDGRQSKAFSTSKSNNDDFTEEILNYFLRQYAISKCDINRGVKYLCDNEIVDFRSLQILNTNSTDTVVMHENLTFKRMYPNEYAAKMRAPLNKSNFAYLLTDRILCNFSSDPSDGQISISVYPHNASQIDNVIGKILENN